MEKAEAMYLAGEIISASDERLDYESYKKEGLRCLSCGEPVFLKRGEKNKPHFAHFPGTDPEQVEECEIRVTDYSNNQGYGNFGASSYEAKGQRLKIFQEHFLNIFARQYPDFSDKESYYEKLQLDIDVVDKCIEWFINNEKSIKVKYPLSTIHVNYVQEKPISPSHNDNSESIYAKKSFFEKRVFHQVIDYLCTKSSYESLKKLIYYSHSKCDSINRLVICYRLLDMLLKVSWLLTLKGVVSKKKRKKMMSNKNRSRSQLITSFCSPILIDVYEKKITESFILTSYIFFDRKMPNHFWFLDDLAPDSELPANLPADNACQLMIVEGEIKLFGSLLEHQKSAIDDLLLNRDDSYGIVALHNGGFISKDVAGKLAQNLLRSEGVEASEIECLGLLSDLVIKRSGLSQVISQLASHYNIEKSVELKVNDQKQINFTDTQFGIKWSKSLNKILNNQDDTYGLTALVNAGFISLEVTQQLVLELIKNEAKYKYGIESIDPDLALTLLKSHTFEKNFGKKSAKSLEKTLQARSSKK